YSAPPPFPGCATLPRPTPPAGHATAASDSTPASWRHRSSYSATFRHTRRRGGGRPRRRACECVPDTSAYRFPCVAPVRHRSLPWAALPKVLKCNESANTGKGESAVRTPPSRFLDLRRSCRLAFELRNSVAQLRGPLELQVGGRGEHLVVQ